MQAAKTIAAVWYSAQHAVGVPGNHLKYDLSSKHVLHTSKCRMKKARKNAPRLSSCAVTVSAKPAKDGTGAVTV